MCRLNISVENSYLVLNVKKRTIRHLVSPVLQKYTRVRKFNKDNGIITLDMLCILKDGTKMEDEDWIDLNDELGFAFRDPKMIINEIDDIHLV